MTNLLRTIRIKFYQNRSGFAEEMTKKHSGVFFGSQCSFIECDKLILFKRSNKQKRSQVFHCVVETNCSFLKI